MSYLEYEEKLANWLIELAPVEAEGVELSFGKPPKPEMGDLAVAAFDLAKKARRNPAEVAGEWKSAVEAALSAEGVLPDWMDVPVTEVRTAGPYLNLRLDAAALARRIVREIVEQRDDYGRQAARSRDKILLEYSSPNTNKPLHLGHIRNNLIGMSLSNLLSAAGHEVVRVNLVNDRGIHICKSMLAYERFGNGETPESCSEKGDHFVGRYYVLFDKKLKEERAAYAEARGIDLDRFSKEAKKALEGDELKARNKEETEFDGQFEEQSELLGGAREMLLEWEAGNEQVRKLWEQMNSWVLGGFKQTYQRMGSEFDHWYYESETYELGKDLVEKGLGLGVFEKHEDGSVWAKLESKKLKDKIVLRSDGTSVYMTQDLGTSVMKHEDFEADRSIYVVGSEQQHHFKVLFAILELLEFPWASGSHHASYGLVTLPRGMGRLKSREGTAVDADDLLDTLHEIAASKIREGGYAEGDDAVEAAAEMIGQGALKLYILQVGPEKNIQFDPNETISFTGDTGPAVQYSHARIHGIVRKGVEQGALSPNEMEKGFLALENAPVHLLEEEEERDVIRQLADFGKVITMSAQNLTVAPVANYLLELTKAYARMYHEHSVLAAATPELMKARIQLALCVAQVLRNGLAILTIEAPERM